MGHLSPNISAKKRKEKKTRLDLGMGMQLHVEHVCKIFRAHLSKLAWTFRILCGKMNEVVVSIK